MNQYLTFLHILIFCWSTILLQGCDRNKAAQIVFKDTEYEFPMTIAGSEIVTAFSFTNEGNTPLHIKGIDTDCGCVATTASAAQIPPGGTGSIRIEIDREVGHFLEQAFVYTNDPDKPMIPLQVSGVIKAPITFPKQINFGKLEKGQNVIKTVTLTNNLTQSVDITAHAVSDDSLTVTLPSRVIPGGGTLEIHAAFSLNTVGIYSEVLTLSGRAPTVIPGTDSEKFELPIQFQGRVLGGIEALPANLFLGVLSPNQAVQRTIQLKTDGIQPFAVLGIAADNFEISAEWDTKKRASHEVFISISANQVPNGLVEDTISIQTDHPDVASIEISVKGVLP